MMIPFIKAEGAGNDFLFTWEHEAPRGDLAACARAICDRHAGVGADGWYLLAPGREGCHAALSLYNSDGSKAELSGNGTRCAAAVLIDAGVAQDTVHLLTGAGPKDLRLVERRGAHFLLEMNMGRPMVPEGGLQHQLPLAAGEREVTLVDVGNPQCAVFVEEFPGDWPRLGAEIEGHPHFPRRTNVSFVRRVDEHTIEARFYERGAGVTLSSGIGATGAAAAAMARGLVSSPVRVLTSADPLELRWNSDVFLAGPATLVARGQFLLL